MLRTYSLSLLYLLCQSLSIHALSLSQNLTKLSPHDAQLILNVLYRSYTRSAITVQTQTNALNQLTQQWDLWHACAARRLDPNAFTQKQVRVGDYEAFVASVAQYHAIHDAYAEIIEYATRSASYHSQDAYRLVVSIREQARSAVLQAMKELFHDIKHDIEAALLAQQNQIDDRSRTEAVDDAATRAGLLNSLVNHIATHSFAEFNERFVNKTDALFHSFLFTQEQFNRLWYAIEITRRDFYAQRYTEVYELLQASPVPPNTLYLLSAGTLTQSSQQPLPSPSQLTTHDLH